MRRVRSRLHITGKDLSEESVKKSDTPLLFDGHGASCARESYQRQCLLASHARSNLAVERTAEKVCFSVPLGFASGPRLTLDVSLQPHLTTYGTPRTH